MPPPTMTTSNCFIAIRVCEIALGCGNTWDHTTFNFLSPFANSVNELGFAIPPFLEFKHGRARGDFDFAVHDGTSRDRNRSSAHLAAYHRGVADLQFVLDYESADDFAGDNRLLRLNETMPGTGGGEVEAALQFTVSMYFARYH